MFEVPARCKANPLDISVGKRRCRYHPDTELVVKRSLLVCIECQKKWGSPSGRYYPRKCFVCQKIFLAYTMQGILCSDNCRRLRRNQLARERYEQGGRR